MGRWKASVLSVTRRRKNRYWSMRGCAWSTAAFVREVWGARRGLAEVVFVDMDEGWWADVCGRESFSMRDQVR